MWKFTSGWRFQCSKVLEFYRLFLDLLTDVHDLPFTYHMKSTNFYKQVGQEYLARDLCTSNYETVRIWLYGKMVVVTFSERGVATWGREKIAMPLVVLAKTYWPYIHQVKKPIDVDKLKWKVNFPVSDNSLLLAKERYEDIFRCNPKKDLQIHS